MEGISREEYKARAERVRQEIEREGWAALILFSDTTRTSNVRYLADIRPVEGVSDISMAIAAVSVDADPVLYVSLMNLLYAQEVAWFPVQPFSELVKGLVDLRTKIGKGTIGVAGLGFMPAGVHDVLRGVFGMSAIQHVGAERFMGRIKARKSPAELALLRRAGELTVVGLDAIQRAVCDRTPKTEREIARYASQELFVAGGDGPSMEICIQSGPHSTYNIMKSTDRVVVAGDSILIEMGAKYRGYVTDIARGATVGAVDPRQEGIIVAAAQAMEVACARLKPGITAGELNSVIAQSMAQSGFGEYSEEAQGHGTGHGIGTDIEEEEPWIRPGSEFVLEENMVFALKASAFIPGLAGVRVEDNLLVTRSGCENLTPYPRVLKW
ncbi:MAG TPA: Xaa-Pro peptidase family protein [Candidatus Baltobacteraceae bacterium]|nr:Xaa-Pro peptidase family protein [Candidatus Baltobacteraceae bacterium]